MQINKSEMTLIPGGIFLMGSDEGNSNERPIHEVKINPFYLDKLVVTNRQYKAFVEANPAWRKTNINPALADGDYLNIWSGDDYPSELADYAVINVSWFAATAYAEWRGVRLPSEAEWEFAAGGENHFKWSLGNDFDAEIYCFGISHDPIGFPVGEYPANGYGLHDMSGGVWEWTRDSYEVNFYERSAYENPLNLTDSDRKSLRGGSGHFDNPDYLRCAVRGSNDPRACHEDYGFRCAADVL